MTTMLLYKDIKALNRDEHKAFKLKAAPHSNFAANTHLVPLAGLEFFQAARHYPIVFVGAGAAAMPIALLGLSEGHNSFLSAESHWRANTYVPAFIRRYPFVLAQTDARNLTVCLDAAYEGWNEEEGRELFAEDGQNSEFLDEMIQFMQHFSLEMDRTRAFVKLLNELELLSPQTLQLSHESGESFVLSDFQAVNEEAFGRLSDAQILTLHRAGVLGWVYAHLMSLGNANQVFEDYLARKST